MPRPWDWTVASAGARSSDSVDRATSLRSIGPQPMCACGHRSKMGISHRLTWRSDRRLWVVRGSLSRVQTWARLLHVNVNVVWVSRRAAFEHPAPLFLDFGIAALPPPGAPRETVDRKSTRLNSSHLG